MQQLLHRYMSIYNLKLFDKSILKIKGTDNVEYELIAQLDRALYSREEIRIEYEGHLIKPKKIPPAIKNGAKGSGTVNGEAINFQLTILPQPSIKLARKVFGERIKVEKLNE